MLRTVIRHQLEALSEEIPHGVVKAQKDAAN
jgi:hypothetical protein